MTPQERKTEFDKLFATIPGRFIKDRIKIVQSILFCTESTVRIYLIKNPTRIIPEAKLKILKQGLARKNL
jgi:hypothetical protein